MADTDTNKINITAEPQMDPDVCKFVIDRIVQDGVVRCTSRERAAGSPLLEGLFAVEGIREVVISGGTITVAKSSEKEWGDLAREVGAVIRDRMQAGGVLIASDFAAAQPTAEELREKIQKVFDEEINPGLGMHGGSVELIDIQGTTVFLTMSGGCHGCAAASYTLRHGIEQILKSRVPEVTEIVDVTDHSTGADPFYR